ncbi:hypothetical protein Tco_1282840 [Tanacetum coccineum]
MTQDMMTKSVTSKVGFSEVLTNWNSTPYFEPIVDTTSPTLTHSRTFFFLKLINSEPLSPLPNHANYFPEVRKELKICEAKTNETSIDEPPEVELKDLPPHLEYAFLEGDNKLPVIIAKDLSVGEKAALIKVLQSHKRAIAWKLSDIKGINPEFCTHKILMEEDYTPAVQHQRRVNPKIHDVIKKEVEKLLDAGLIYPISDSPWFFSTCSNPLGKDGLSDVKTPNLCSETGRKAFHGLREGIVLDIKSPSRNLMSDRAKIDLSKAPSPDCV